MYVHILSLTEKTLTNVSWTSTALHMLE